MGMARLRSWFRDEGKFIASSLAFLLLIHLGWAHPGTITAQTDLGVLVDPVNDARGCFSVWSHISGIGQLNACFGFVPALLAYAAMNHAFGVSLGIEITFWIMAAFAWLGAFRLGRALEMTPLASFIVAWAYEFFPEHQHFIGKLPTFEVAAALIPWLFYLLWIARNREARPRALLGIAVVAAIPAAILTINPQLLIEILLGCLVWLVFAARFPPVPDKYFPWVGRGLLVVLFVSLWWAIPGGSAYFLGHAIRSTDPMANAWTFARASLLNELRFNPSWGWVYREYYPYAPEFERNLLFYATCYVLPFGLIAALLTTRGRVLGIVRFCGAFALALLFLSKGTHAPLEQFNLWIYSIPYLFLLLEPTGLAFIAALCMAITLGFALDALPAKELRFKPRAVAVAVMIALGLNNLAAITGAIMKEPTNWMPAVHVKISEDWLALAKFLNHSAPPGNVALVPANKFYQSSYTWGLIGIDNLANDLFQRNIIIPGQEAGYVTSPEQASITEHLVAMFGARSSLAAPALRDLGVRYVVFRGDLYSNDYLLSDDEVAELFHGYPRRTFGSLVLYDLGPPSAPLTLAGSIVAERSTPRAAGDQLELRALEEPLPRVRQESLTPSLEGRVALVESAPDGALPPANRLVWRDPASPAPVAWTGPGELRAAYFAGGPPNELVVRRYAELHHVEVAGFPVPRLVGFTDIDTHSSILDIINPSHTLVECDVSVGINSRWGGDYSMSANGGTPVVMRERPTRGPAWVRFAGIRLLPGTNHLALSAPGHLLNAMTPFFPPRRITGGAWEPHENQIRFSNIRERPEWLRLGDVPDFFVHSPTIGVQLGVTASSDPYVQLDAGMTVPGRGSGWILDLRVGKHVYQCFAPFEVGRQYRLLDTIRECFAVLRPNLNHADETHIDIESLSLFAREERIGDWLPPFEVIRIWWRNPPLATVGADEHRFVLPPMSARPVVWRLPSHMTKAVVQVSDRGSSVSILTIGAAPLHGRPSNVRADLELGGLYAANVGRSGILVTSSDLYDWGWSAIELAAGIRGLRHFEVDSWRNGWYLERPGYVVAWHWLALFQWLFLIATLVVLAWLWKLSR